MSQSAAPPLSKNHVRTSFASGFDDKLASYALAAGAAGVAMIALAQTTYAEIVYTSTYRAIPQGGSVALDLNHDGKTDFTIHSSFATCTFVESHCWFQQLEVIPGGQNRVVAEYGDRGEIPFPRALSSGEKIGWQASFSTGGIGYAAMDRCKATRTSYYLYGSWAKQKNRYLGLKFIIEGKVHFGWARLNLPIEGGLKCKATPVLTGYAYETEPGVTILAGATSDSQIDIETAQPKAGLGALAAGSTGLDVWRRDEEP